MIFRRTMQLASVCLAICFYAAAQVNPGSNFLFHIPVPGTDGTRVIGYLANTNDLNADLDVTGPANPTQILPTPDGSRVYLVANGALQVFSATLQALQGINGITGPIRNITMTPDGKYLLIAGAQFYILSTATDAIVATNLGISGAVADFAVSPDSTRAWVLQSIPFFNSITPINLTDLTAGTKVSITRAGDTITYSPQGKLYVPSRNVIAEYDATTLAFVRDTFMQALPGRLHFNLEGTKAYFVDKSETQGFAIVSFTPSTQVTTGWPTNIFTTYRPIFDEIYVAGPGRIFGLERSKSTLWEITDSPLNAAPANMAGFDSSIVFGAAVTNEIPTSRYLYVLTENSARPTLARVSLANGSLETFANALVSTGALRYTGIPPQVGASQVLKFNDAQTLNEGGAAKTLFAYVTDPLGRPIYNQQVTFTTDSASSAATISNASLATNADGFVQADVTVPNVAGTYTITLTAGGATGAFTLTVPSTGGNGGNGGDPEAPPRMTIYRGNGQLIADGNANPIWAPLTVKVVDQSGNPQGGVTVNFTLLEGYGQPFPNAAVTNEFGYAAVDYQVYGMTDQYAFFRNTIRASSDVGSVEFSEISFNKSLLSPDLVPMSTSILTPDRATVRRGDVTPRLFAVEIHSTRSPQIGEAVTGFGVRASRGDSEMILDSIHLDTPAGTCVNDILSDTNGVAVCDFQASCSLDAPTQIRFAIGEVFFHPMVVIPAPGSGRLLTYVSGNDQSANVGQAIASPLIATLTDNCGDPVVNQTVTWTVTQGAATLLGTSSTTNNNGQVFTRVTMGQAAGVIKVTVAAEGAEPVVFTLNATVSVSSITLNSGGGQTVNTGEAFPSPIVFTLRTSSGTPVGPNISVNFALTGSGSLGNTQATTNANGQVQTTVTAGPNPGSMVVTATYANLSASANLTVRPPTLPLTAASFSNAASGATGLVPCGLAVAVGNGLAPNVNGVVNGSPFGGFGPFDTLVSGVSLRINGVLAPILAVSNQNGKQQVNFQTPCEATPGNATVVVTVNGVETTIQGVPVFAAQPGISTFIENGKNYPVVLRAKDNSLVRPNNLPSTGETLYLLYVTGMGLVTPSTATNQNGGQNQTAILQPNIGVNNRGNTTQAARYSFGQIGLYYIEFKIDRDPAKGVGQVSTDVPFTVLVNVNGTPMFSQPGVLLPGMVEAQ